MSDDEICSDVMMLSPPAIIYELMMKIRYDAYTHYFRDAAILCRRRAICDAGY